MDLTAERLVVRRFTQDDWHDLRDYICTPEVSAWEPDYPSGDKGAQDMATYFAATDDFWAAELRDRRKVIGHIHFGQKEPKETLTWNLGYVFNPTYYRCGYATEACRHLLRYGFEEIGVRRVEAGCNPDNVASWRLLERLGLRREAHHLQNAVIKHNPDGTPIFWDSFIYAMLREEWLNRAV
jgi:RimJ/RimL family protein N-acetyltransferase